MFTDAPAVADERQLVSAPHEDARTSSGYRIRPCGQHDARRDEAEAFVRKRFQRVHGAHIATFMPTLLLLDHADGGLAAVAGYRCAEQEPLFLERYLPGSIEQALSAHIAAPPRRAEIVEIGNFAAIDSRRARILMSFMPAYFLERSARWITFTATAAIRGILTAMGGQCLELACADGACAAGGMDEWGCYYSKDPRVMAGFLPSARRIPALWRSHHGN